MLKRVASLPFILAIVVSLPSTLAAQFPPRVDGVESSKLSTDLRQLIQLARESGGVVAQTQPAVRAATIQVVLQTNDADLALVRRRVEAAGGAFERAAKGLVLARVPLSALETLAAAPEIEIIRRPRAPVPMETTSEGVAAIGATAWHSAGRTGRGVKVAILDVGFDGYWYLMGNELPQIPSSHIASFSGDISGGGEKHGAGVAEIIHDVAPDAELYLVNFSNEVELEDAVDWLIEQRVDVINTSWGYPCGGPVDGTGFVDELVERAADAGIVWVTAAGNYAQRHWSAAFSDTNANKWHNFTAAEEGNKVHMESGDELRVCIVWDDWTNKDQNLDLYVWDGNSDVVKSSTDVQSGPNTNDPVELLTFTAGTTADYYIGVYRRTGSRNPKIHMYAYPPGTECAIESAASVLPAPQGLLDELRQFRDHVLERSSYGAELVASYYRHSREVVHMLLLHPLLAADAAALLNDSRPAVRQVLAERAGRESGQAFVITAAYAARVDRFLDALTSHASESLRRDLDAFRSRAPMSDAVGLTAAGYWEKLLALPSFDVRAGETYPDSGYMHHVTPGGSLVPPADSRHALTVAAVDWNTNVLEEFSSRGPTDDGRTKPDIAAPDGVCTTTYGDCGGNGFRGTSAAAPHVAGAAVLVRQVYPSLSAAEVRGFLSARAIDVLPRSADNATGAGRLALGATSNDDALPPPDLSTPKGNDAEIWPTFQWSPVNRAESYRLMVAQSASALPRDAAVQTCSACVVNVTTSNEYYTPPAVLLAGTSYVWQVQGRAPGKNGTWSAIASFKTSGWPESSAPIRSWLPEDSSVAPVTATRAALVTHGWNASALPWVTEMADALCDRLGAGGRSSLPRPDTLTKVCQSKGWDVWVLDWSTDAGTGLLFPGKAYVNGQTVGEMVASTFVPKTYAHVHFIAHSAGANVIHSATQRLREERPNVEIHDTFLDAYEPSRIASYYGSGADWADNYVDTRKVAYLGLDGTSLFLTNGFNIDVTPDKSGDDPCEPAWLNEVCRHSRPYRFYGQSIDSLFIGDAGYASYDPVASTAGTGYPFSTENNLTLKWLGDHYKKGTTCVVTGATCVEKPTPGEQSGFNIVRVARTVTKTVGNVLWTSLTTNLLFESIKLGFVTFSGGGTPSTTAAQSPSYLVADVTTTEPVNRMQLQWRFTAGGEGFVRIFVDGMLVREIDQRFVRSGVVQSEEIYVGGANGELAPGTHHVAFRLDGFGASASGVELTDIAWGDMRPGLLRRRAVHH